MGRTLMGRALKGRFEIIGTFTKLLSYGSYSSVAPSARHKTRSAYLYDESGKTSLCIDAVANSSLTGIETFHIFIILSLRFFFPVGEIQFAMMLEGAPISKTNLVSNAPTFVNRKIGMTASPSFDVM
jgi:hypothetical protein